ncbi:HK97 family phage prohead protease [Pseudogemmobacter bohemicus]|uniref:HK97 family phage prohead protease n=1 Tax=Pseudogemmobacter bohemicus TaxID=2250708 RepID=UPI000DD3DD70|nr:HK97 family phage prohead protease [Pseudogemmobacter bohemicus]
MEHKNFNIEIKAEDTEAGTFEGYANVFGVVDRVGDIVMPGAFTATLATSRKVKFLFQHDANQILGVIDELKEDETGLFIKGRWADTDRATEIRELVKMKAIEEFSIGYRTLDYAYDNEGNRLLKAVDLWEVSAVTFPANPDSKITDSKSIDDEKLNSEILRLLNIRMNILS